MCDVKLLNCGLLWVLMTETKAHYRKPSQTELLHEYYVRNYNIGVHYPFLIKFVVQKFLTDTILKIKNCFGDVLFVKVTFHMIPHLVLTVYPYLDPIFYENKNKNNCSYSSHMENKFLICAKTTKCSKSSKSHRLIKMVSVLPLW